MTQQEVDEAFSKFEVHDYRQDDAQRIKDVVYNEFAVSITLGQAVIFWEDYSDRYAAGWLGIDSDEEIISAFTAFVSSECELVEF